MKHILITGATSGIGFALCKLALESGYRVTACGRNTDTLDTLACDHLTTLKFDVTETASTCQALADQSPDIVVLNAGICEYVDSSNFTSQAFRTNMSVNVFGATNVIEALLGNLNEGSQLVFVDSLARLFPFTRASAYGASKAALHYLANSLRVDFPQFTIQTVSPGFVKTPLTDKNTFDMPMLVDSDIAAKIMLRGIEKQKLQIQFPMLFTLFLKLLGTLPIQWQTKLGQIMKENSNK